MPVLFGREEPLPLGDASLGLSLTAEELSEFDGRPLSERPGETAALLLSINGRIYDVTAGKAHYGPGRSYHKLVGKDATRAFCTGCLEPACLIPNTAGLRDDQLKEADRWIELYEHQCARPLDSPRAGPCTAGCLARSAMCVCLRMHARTLACSCACVCARFLSPTLCSYARRGSLRSDKYKLVGQLREAAPDVSADGDADDDAAAAEEAAEAAAAAAEWERERVERAEVAERSKKHKPFRPR